MRDTTPPAILWSFTNLVLAAGTNCTAPVPNVTGTNYVLASNLSGTLTITQVPTYNTALPLGTNVVVITVADASGNASYSTNQILVQDQTPPVIVLQPESQTATAGANASFGVTAGACTPLSFQWYFDNTTLAAQTNSTLALSDLNTSAAGSYFAVVTASGGSATSTVATLTVVLPPTITLPPSAQTVQCGSNAAFSVTATGTTPLIYQWSLDSVPIAGATHTSLSLTNVHLPTHTVAVVVTNLYGSATSSALLTVQDTLPPVITLLGSTPAYVELGSAFIDPGATADDLCMGVVPVTSRGTVNTNAVSTNTVTYTAPDGNGNTNTATRTVIVRDTTPPTILWSFTNLVLAAGTNCTAPVPNVTGTNYVLATDLSGTLTITQVPTYNTALPLGTNVVVITVADASGNASYSTNQILVQDQTPPVIVLQPESQTATAGANASFGVTAGACTPLSFQWYFDNTTLAAQTNSTLALSDLNTSAAGSYFAVVTAAGGSATSTVATLTVVLPPTITLPPSAQTVQCGSNAAFSVTASGTTPLIYQWSLDSVPIAGATHTSLSLTNVHLPTHTVAVVVTNPYGSATSSALLTVQDTLPPVITLIGSTPAYVELGSAFIDPGATADDLCMGVVPVTSRGTVNTNAVSTNTVTYAAPDGNGNTNTATRTVIVRDTTPPTILWSFTNLVLAAGTNCTAPVPNVTGTNYVLATDLSGTLTITQVPTYNTALPLGTNVVVITVADASGNASYSTNQILVQDQTPPVIVLQPESQTATAGANASFGVTAGACTPLSFQWYFDNTTLAAQTNSTLALSDLNTSAAGSYFAVVTAAGGSATSTVATLTVVLPPTITLPPSAQTVQCGSNAAFSVTASGTTPLIYQWSLDSVPIAGATHTSLSLTNVHLPTHTVAVVVTNPYGSATSSALLTVQDTLPPVITLIGSTPAYVELGSAFIDPGATADDLCVGVVPVTSRGTVNTNAVSTNTVTYAAPDGNGNTNTATRTVIVRDTTPPTILWSFTNLVLAAGTNCTAPVPNVTGTNYVLASNLSGTLTVTQVPTYNTALPLGTNVVVITVADASGNASYSTNQILVQDQTPPVIVLQPESQTATAGANASFGVTAGACTPLSFQWYFDNTTLAAQTNSTLALSDLNTSAAGSYFAVVTASGGSATSTVATLTVVLPPTITLPPSAQTVQCGSNAAFSVTATGTTPLIYQWSLDSVPIAGATHTSLSLTNVHLPTHTVAVVVTNPYGSATSSALLTVQDTLPPVITLLGSTPAYVELGSAFIDPGATADDLCMGVVPVTSRGTVNTNAVSTNTVTYTAPDGNGNTNTATRTVIVRDTTPPTILWSFTNLVLAAGTNCTAPVPNVTGTNYVLATDLSGTLTITQVPTYNTALPLGTNVVVITVADASGNASYSTNQILVQDQTPPVIVLQPESQTATAGANASFGVTAGACTPLSFQWYFDNTTLAAQTNSTLALSDLNTSAAGSYFAVVTASGGSATSTVATLTVVLPPTITLPPSAQTVQCGSNAAFSVTATGTTPLIYQWSLDSVPIAGATHTSLSLTNVHLPTHTVAVVVTNPYGSATSSALLTVQDTLPPVITLLGSTPAYVELGSAFIDPGATADDLCMGVVPVTSRGTVNTNAVSTNTVTYTAPDGNGNTNTATRTVIVRDTTPPTILWSFTNLVLAAGTNCTAPVPNVTGTNYVLATDLSGTLTITQVPTYNTALPLGTNVVVITVADASGNASYSTNQILVQDQTPPVIVLQPESQTATAGANASFGVTAGACTPLSFQWYFDNTTLAAQTNSTLALSDLNTSAAGSYFAVVIAAGGSATSTVATLTVNLLASSVALTSSENPSGLKDSLIFTATVTPSNAAGTIQFLTNGVAFDAQTLVTAQAVSTNITSLPRGTNIVTAIYSGDASDLPATNTLAQVVTNHPPVAADASYIRAAGGPLYIALTNLAAYWSDVDRDTVSLAAVGVSADGVTVTNTAGTLVYINPNNVADQFVCTITDGWGGTNSQTVNISVVWLAITSVVANASGSVTLDLTAAPGFTYILERTVNLVPPLWLPVATNTLGTNGVWQFTDAQAANFQQGFYRLKLAQ